MEQVKKQCSHPEAHVAGVVDEGGKVYTVHVEVHDCEYVDSRNALIPFAEAVAHRSAGWRAPKGETARPAWCAAWNRAFSAEMDRLWAARCAGVAKMRRAA